MPMSMTKTSRKPTIRSIKKGKSPSLSHLLAWGMQRAGLTGNKLAQRAGLNQAIVSRLVSGRRCNPMPETVEALAEALDIPASEIWAARRVSKGMVAIVGSAAADTSAS
jgi:transcriptional regulator with XRE-family HTH domain